jgi:hypothetical protein
MAVKSRTVFALIAVRSFALCMIYQVASAQPPAIQLGPPTLNLELPNSKYAFVVRQPTDDEINDTISKQNAASTKGAIFARCTVAANGGLENCYVSLDAFHTPVLESPTLELIKLVRLRGFEEGHRVQVRFAFPGPPPKP